MLVKKASEVINRELDIWFFHLRWQIFDDYRVITWTIDNLITYFIIFSHPVQH